MSARLLVLALLVTACAVEKSDSEELDTAAIDDSVADESSSSADPSASTYAETGAGEDSSSGEEPADECSTGTAPEVVVTVQPQAEVDEMLMHFLHCTIAVRSGSSPDPVAFGLDCVDASGNPFGAPVGLSVDAPGIVVPEDLQPGSEVETRVFTWRTSTADYWGGDHFVLLQDGDVVLAAGNGSHWPSTDAVYVDEFTAPVRLEAYQTSCPTDPAGCQERWRGHFGITIAGEHQRLPDFSVGVVSDYTVHVGTMITSASATCEEPTRGWIAYAIARQ